MRQTTMVKVIRINRGDDNMTNEQAQKVLDELNEIKPEQLEGNAKRLFEAIMKIADDRDKIKQKYDRDTHILQNQLDLANAENVKKDKQIERYQNILATNDMLHIKESQEKDEIINLMANEIDSLHSSLIGEFGTWETEYSKQGEEATIEEIKQYFENKAKELLNK